MKTWTITASTDAGVKHYELTAATLQAALGKAMRDVLALGETVALAMDWEALTPTRHRRKMTDAEKLARKIERDKKRLAEMEVADGPATDAR